MKSVECYDVGVEVLNGIMYVVGGVNKLGIYKCVEAYSPSDGVWTSIADIHLGRENPGDYNC